MAPSISHSSGTLYIVATPIGNLEDVTLRALRVLEKEVALIAAEDTRRTAKLLARHGIQTKTTSFHAHNEARKTPVLLRRLKSGDSIALVSDAGTPLLSDPGAKLVNRAIEEEVQVQSVPGPSAVLAALVMSGLGGSQFTFVGFPPSRSQARTKWLASLAAEPRPLVLFEAPHRIQATLKDTAAVLGDRRVAICRELTKINEELVIGPISSVLTRLNKPRGEFTVVITPDDSIGDTIDRPTSRQIWLEFGQLTKNRDLSRREALRQIARKYSMSTREVFSAVEAEKSSMGQTT